ncbi:DUF3422 family protein [Nitrosomonas eutropha]|uniref:Membrane-anchored protein n=2 Tax=Nitrosomonas eutropha TaxID=916 RepID=A0ABX5M7A4_9PROT|nr:DUF3422 domain-containing protein [Nitrosomonas eutropha]ABI60199.1 conserved hypothetical protein [Nitrosomonas eutropha C91]PXV75068.1 putative membrane-anchored protein [Nitrosomonas eutropha]SEI99588.1 Uncharacterized membrane-anchored protein [Nitrosomonas eutropha]
MTDTLLKSGLTDIPEYFERKMLHDELNADVYELVNIPLQLSHLVLLSDRQWVNRERGLVIELCKHFDIRILNGAFDQLSVELGDFHLRWERHTEYSTYTFYREGPFDEPFAQPAIAYVPQEWLAKLPGELLVATHIVLEDRRRPGRSMSELATLFSSNTVIGSKVSAGSASVWSDNQIHPDGFTRFLVHDDNLRSRQVGRLVQRLLEIETYRMLTILPLSMTREIIPQLEQYGDQLIELMTTNATPNSIEDEQQSLVKLTALATEIERISAQSSHRFSASHTYHIIMQQRITELREERIEGLQMLYEFRKQRVTSAMSTFDLVRSKLDTLSLRVERATSMLRTRVDISMESQIRDLLKSMDARAYLQLRLQETVEGLSVVVLSYYLLGITGYGLRAAKAAGLDIDIELMTGIAIPIVLTIVFFAIRRFRRIVSKSTTRSASSSRKKGA